MENQETRGLCEICHKVDFGALFSPGGKAFRLGTLSYVAQNETCPLCDLVSTAAKTHWVELWDAAWSRAHEINFWIKTTLWGACHTPAIDDLVWQETNLGDAPDFETRANCTEDRERRYGHHYRSKCHRYRPAIRTDWAPSHQNQSLFGVRRFTVCEVDRVLIKETYVHFPRDELTDWAQILKRRLVPQTVDFSLLRSWINQCQKTHEHCDGKLAKQVQLGRTGRFRVVDTDRITLVKPTSSVDYVALSYIWGDFLRSLHGIEMSQWQANLFEPDDGSQSESRLRLENLPATIRDAITVAKFIGWRYLWVDLLCIRQNDDADKNALVNMMNLVYEGASFTIVAASGNDPFAGLPGVRETVRDPQPVWPIETDAVQLALTTASPSPEELVSRTAWSCRGWTYQEDVLSSCCLYFTRDEVFYSCEGNSKIRRRTIWPGGNGNERDKRDFRLSEWRESYVLETQSIETAYQACSPWGHAWLRNPAQSLRRNADVRSPTPTPGSIESASENLELHRVAPTTGSTATPNLSLSTLGDSSLTQTIS